MDQADVTPSWRGKWRKNQMHQNPWQFHTKQNKTKARSDDESVNRHQRRMTMQTLTFYLETTNRNCHNFKLYFLESIPIISIKLDNPWPNILGKWLRKYRIFPKFCGKCNNYPNVTNLLSKEINAQVQQYKPLNLEKDKKYVQSYQ